MPTYAPKGSISSVTIDCNIFGFEDSKLKVLLVVRDIEPQKGMWALPGGWIAENEDMDVAAQRILEEATGVNNIYMEQVQAFGKVGRYPLERIITIGYTALIRPDKYSLKPGPETSDVRWFDIEEIPPLTFDHNHITEKALEHLRRRIKEVPIGFELLPRKFTMPEITSLYEVILGKDLDRRNFRKKLLNMKIIERLDETRKKGGHRAARLYRFDQASYDRMRKDGLIYDFTRVS